jgi:hypothetical protein
VYVILDFSLHKYTPALTYFFIKGYPLAKTFSSYFRLMVAHLGVVGWQMGLMDSGLPTWVHDWMSFYSPERAGMFSPTYNQVYKVF